MKQLVKEMLEVSVNHGQSSGVIPWGCPIPAFGNFMDAEIATVGINPSNREFTDENMVELIGNARRFPTLKSLGLSSWRSATNREIQKIVDACTFYFDGPSYDLWFRKLDGLLTGAGYSYYPFGQHACHLDLVPWATYEKWTNLPNGSKQFLLKLGSRFLAQIINETPVRILIFNGSTILKTFQEVAEIDVETTRMRNWNLPRQNSEGVLGYSYEGSVTSIAGVKLKRKAFILGYNHNLQSSFGVTRVVQKNISTWISNRINCLQFGHGKDTSQPRVS